MKRATRCKSTYPGLATLNGRPVRCDGPAGHDGQHGNGYAARYWGELERPCLTSCGCGGASSADRCMQDRWACTACVPNVPDTSHGMPCVRANGSVDTWAECPHQ